LEHPGFGRGWIRIGADNERDTASACIISRRTSGVSETSGLWGLLSGLGLCGKGQKRYHETARKD